MFAVIETGGKQYRVLPDQVVKIEKIEGNIGDKVIIDKVHLIRDDKQLYVGTPFVKDGLVEGVIESQERDKKVIVFKKKRRKGYHKKQGHRQDVTLLRITDIHAPVTA